MKSNDRQRVYRLNYNPQTHNNNADAYTWPAKFLKRFSFFYRFWINQVVILLLPPMVLSEFHYKKQRNYKELGQNVKNRELQLNDTKGSSSTVEERP
jgi:hypothetical protein